MKESINIILFCKFRNFCLHFVIIEKLTKLWLEMHNTLNNYITISKMSFLIFVVSIIKYHLKNWEFPIIINKISMEIIFYISLIFVNLIFSSMIDIHIKVWVVYGIYCFNLKVKVIYISFKLRKVMYFENWYIIRLHTVCYLN